MIVRLTEIIRRQLIADTGFGPVQVRGKLGQKCQIRLFSFDDPAGDGARDSLVERANAAGIEAIAEMARDNNAAVETTADAAREMERLAEAGEWTPLYDRLTPYVLGMEPLPGLKVELVVPLVMPLSVAHFTASA